MEPTPELPQWLAPQAATLRVYAGSLATVGVELGLLGPREVDRIWTRHILNCAVVADPVVDLVRVGDQVADVGSGAGLPGLVWAIARPDINVTLIEPLLRRADYLATVLTQLVQADATITERVQVLRTRAEDLVRETPWQPFDLVTARAVAPMNRLLGWTAPLLREGGRLVALKGQSAATEVEQSREQAHLVGMGDLNVLTVGAGIVEPPTTVIMGVRITTT
ncbi:MAG: 16S rRNA (guanine(527)-N(7))-methyltransferase RsmG [Actinomycetales bacterium]